MIYDDDDDGETQSATLVVGADRIVAVQCEQLATYRLAGHSCIRLVAEKSDWWIPALTLYPLLNLQVFTGFSSSRIHVKFCFYS